MEVDTSNIPTSATTTLFYPATNSVNVEDELEWQTQHFQLY
jgi:hypothetical protein